MARRTGRSEPTVAMGRRVFLSVGALCGLGVVFGGAIQRGFTKVTSGSLGGIGGGWRYYSIVGTSPVVTKSEFQLEVSGLVKHHATYSFNDLLAMPQTTLTKDFHCVTGWSVPDVHWVGVKLSHLLELAGVDPTAVAVTFESYDRADTESLTIDQAHFDDVLVAHSMEGGPITVDHGGPVRLYVGRMFGYKSLKWLSAIRVVDAVQPGYWEQNGYPTNGWVDGSTGDTAPIGLT